MQAQEKPTWGGWSTTQGEGRSVKFVGTKKRSAKGEELNTLIASVVAKAKAMKMINKSKLKDTY